MGKTNSKLPTLPTLPPPSTSTSFNPGIAPKPLRKESVLKKKILTNERKMVIYNICPKHLTRVKNYRRLESVFSKQKYHIRSLQIEANSPLLGDLKLLKIFHKLRNLNSLEIDFSRDVELSINKMKSLAKTLSSLKQLKHCRIKNDDPDEVSLKGSYLLMTGLSKLHNLKQVDLAWTTWMVKKAHEKLLARLVLRTMKLRKAEKFALDLSSCGDLTDEVLKKFGEKLSRLHKIRELSLDLRHNEEISRDEINSVVEKLARLKLSSLELKLGGNVISEEKDIFAVCWILPKFEKLEKLSLMFEGIQDTRQKVIGYLVENLNQLKQLKELTLNLSGCKDLTNFEGITLVEDITFFERLRKLHLDLSFCSLSDSGLMRLSKSFVRLEKLEDLCLSFRGQETATDHSLVSIGQNIAQIKGLKYLEFDFSKTLMSDQGLDHFMHHVAKLGQLKGLTLHFTMIKNITEKGVSALGRHLNNLQGLVKLDIDLCHCPQIKDQGVIALTRAVGAMRSLVQPKLRLYHCGTFSKGVEAMLTPYAQKGKC